MPVGAMVREHQVAFGVQRADDADRTGFLADAGVNRAGQLASLEQFQQRTLDGSYQVHPRVELTCGLGVEPTAGGVHLPCRFRCDPICFQFDAVHGFLPSRRGWSGNVLVGADVRGRALGNRVPLVVPCQTHIQAAVDADRIGAKMEIVRDRIRQISPRDRDRSLARHVGRRALLKRIEGDRGPGQRLLAGRLIPDRRPSGVLGPEQVVADEVDSAEVAGRAALPADAEFVVVERVVVNGDVARLRHDGGGPEGDGPGIAPEQIVVDADSVVVIGVGLQTEFDPGVVGAVIDPVVADHDVRSALDVQVDQVVGVQVAVLDHAVAGAAFEIHAFHVVVVDPGPANDEAVDVLHGQPLVIGRHAGSAFLEAAVVVVHQAILHGDLRGARPADRRDHEAAVERMPHLAASDRNVVSPGLDVEAEAVGPHYRDVLDDHVLLVLDVQQALRAGRRPHRRLDAGRQVHAVRGSAGTHVQSAAGPCPLQRFVEIAQGVLLGPAGAVEEHLVGHRRQGSSPAIVLARLRPLQDRVRALEHRPAACAIGADDEGLVRRAACGDNQLLPPDLSSPEQHAVAGKKARVRIDLVETPPGDLGAPSRVSIVALDRIDVIIHPRAHGRKAECTQEDRMHDGSYSHNLLTIGTDANRIPSRGNGTHPIL